MLFESATTVCMIKGLNDGQTVTELKHKVTPTVYPNRIITRKKQIVFYF